MFISSIFHLKFPWKMSKIAGPKGTICLLVTFFSEASGVRPKEPRSWLVVEKSMALIFHFIYRMSSFPLTNSYFSRCFFTTNQKPESSIISKHKPQNSAIYLIGGPTHLVHDGEDLMVS